MRLGDVGGSTYVCQVDIESRVEAGEAQVEGLLASQRLGQAIFFKNPKP